MRFFLRAPEERYDNDWLSEGSVIRNAKRQTHTFPEILDNKASAQVPVTWTLQSYFGGHFVYMERLTIIVQLGRFVPPILIVAGIPPRAKNDLICTWMLHKNGKGPAHFASLQYVQNHEAFTSSSYPSMVQR